MDDSSDPVKYEDIDVLLSDIAVLRKHEDLQDLLDLYLRGDYPAVLQTPLAQQLCMVYLDHAPEISELWYFQGAGPLRVLIVGLAAFNAFLQANVTGPPLPISSPPFSDELEYHERSPRRKKYLESLDVDGLSVYQHIPLVYLFCLSRAIFTQYFPIVESGNRYDSKWMRLRINVYHQRLLSTGPSNALLSDSAVELQRQIDADLLALQDQILKPDSHYSTETRVHFLLEKAQLYIMQGLDVKARENLHMAKAVSKFSYALSGALGKRTRFQQKDTSQLVVFAKSAATGDPATDLGDSPSPNEQLMASNSQSSERLQNGNGPMSLELKDDTLLESIEFSNASEGNDEKTVLPPDLAELRPDEQPQLNALDQIILLTEATLKDVLSPLDKLNSEEILPYAVRVLNDKPTNWQIYTQALIVRSRIESHRSRTQERSVLQLQVIVDQIIADTQEEMPSSHSGGVPEIQITSFIPRLNPSESAPVMERLKYIFQLNTPTRWEIETELAYAWSNVGSFVSALEIFKRLQLWSEVALCYHSVGQEDKARQVIRRQLYFSSNGPEMDKYGIDAVEVITENWDGEIRTPSPPHAPRMWCILGDLDQDPKCWERAWEISKQRYVRAQRTLGEYYARQGDLERAREAYVKATVVNRQNSGTWSRLGDIDLRVGNWDGAIIAFQQSIMIDDTDAKTFSNLGTALISKHTEMIEVQKSQPDTSSDEPNEDDITFDESEPMSTGPKETVKPTDLLRQALTAYKRGASIAYSNWQIWDNVITIALRMSPPSYTDILLAMRSILRIRAPSIGEEAVDMNVLSSLITAVVSQERPDDEKETAKESGTGRGVHASPRGSLARAVLEMVDTDILPLITNRGEIYTSIEKLRLWTRDYVGALSCAEKAYRIAISGTAWLEDEEKWQDVVSTTENLVDGLENYGEMETETQGGKKEMVEKQWKSKARSALRGVIGKAKDIWGETDEFGELKERLDELKGS